MAVGIGMITDLGIVIGDTGPAGPAGAAGPVGATGPAAGFGNVTAHIDDNGGNPSVEVITSGEDSSKNFSFLFHNVLSDLQALTNTEIENMLV